MNLIAKGWWTTDAPLTEEQIAEDRAVLDGVVIPEVVHIESATFYVNGRLWKWHEPWVSFGDVARSGE